MLCGGVVRRRGVGRRVYAFVTAGVGIAVVVESVGAGVERRSDRWEARDRKGGRGAWCRLCI